MQRFLAKLMQKGAETLLETQDLQKAGLVKTPKQATQVVTARALQSFQAAATRLKGLPPEEYRKEIAALREEWGIQEAMDWLQATGVLPK